MARTKKTVSEETVETNEYIYEEPEELDLDKKVTVTNIAPWPLGFRGITEQKDVTIPAHGTIRLTRNEIISQCGNNNRLFTGTDGVGSHATAIINDAPTRIEVNFEDPDRKQNVFSEDTIKEMFKITSQEKFEESFKKAIVTRAEMYAAIMAIQKYKFNDYKKIRFVEKYTGIGLE